MNPRVAFLSFLLGWAGGLVWMFITLNGGRCD